MSRWIPFLSRILTESRMRWWENVLIWAAPPLVIPALRYFQDPPDTRKKLFVRDFSTYSLGAGLFFATGFGVYKLLEKTRAVPAGPIRKALAFGAALTANLLYAGIGAIRLSNWLMPTAHHVPKEPVLPPPVRAASQIPVYRSQSAPMQITAGANTWTPYTAPVYYPRYGVGAVPVLWGYG